eukprot:5784147-Amphidinium_carterae.1
MARCDMMSAVAPGNMLTNMPTVQILSFGFHHKPYDETVQDGKCLQKDANIVTLIARSGPCAGQHEQTDLRKYAEGNHTDSERAEHLAGGVVAVSSACVSGSSAHGCWLARAESSNFRAKAR